MKRPKVPNLRIPKKYRDGKLLAAVMDVLELRFEAAKEIQDPATRFDALAKLENKVDKHWRYLWRQIHRRAAKQDAVLGVGGMGGGMTVAFAAMVLAAPPLLIAAIPMATVPVLVSIYNPLADRRNKKNEMHPLARLEQLAHLYKQVDAELTQTALAHPLLLVEKTRFKALCGENADLRDALSAAVVKVQSEKPIVSSASAPDLTSALSKPRLPAPPKR